LLRRREEAVQGAGMVGPFPAQVGAGPCACPPRATTGGRPYRDASVRLYVRSHVPGTRRDRAQAEEAAVKKLEIRISKFETNPKDQNGRKFEAGPAGGASVLAIGVLDFEFVSDFVLRISDSLTLNRLRRTSQVHATLLGCWTGGRSVHSVYAPEPPLWTRGGAGPGSVRKLSSCAKQ